MTSCYLVKFGHMENGDPMPPCDGRHIRAHLIDQQELKRRGLDPDDPATWVYACGGITGLSGHHGMFDVSLKLRLAYVALPLKTLVYARVNGLDAWVERRYRCAL